MTNPLHRKKLSLLLDHWPQSNVQALQFDTNAVLGKTRSKFAAIDVVLFSREDWLDEIGLPQYKNSFDRSNVDGLVLSQLNAVEKRKTTELDVEFTFSLFRTTPNSSTFIFTFTGSL